MRFFYFNAILTERARRIVWTFFVHIRNLDFGSYIGLQGTIACVLVMSILLFRLYFPQVGYEAGNPIFPTQIPIQLAKIPGLLKS